LRVVIIILVTCNLSNTLSVVHFYADNRKLQIYREDCEGTILTAIKTFIDLP